MTTWKTTCYYYHTKIQMQWVLLVLWKNKSIMLYLMMWKWQFLIEVRNFVHVSTKIKQILTMNMILRANCPEESFNSVCMTMTVNQDKKCQSEWKILIGDSSSHIFKNNVCSSWASVSKDDLTIAASNYRNNKQKWKITEALIIKNLKPSLNVQKKSVALIA